MITKIAIICAVVAVGAYIYLTGYIDLGNREEQNTVEKITEGAFAPKEENAMKGSGTFANLLGIKKNVVCDVSYTQKESTSVVSGKVYASGNNMRANFTTVNNGESVATSVINDGTMMYLWGKTQGGDTAMKFAIDTTGAQSGNSKQFDMNTDVDYSCQNWNVDASYFVPPSNLTFIDASAMMQTQKSKAGQPSVSDMKQIQCGGCAQIPDTKGKAECLAMFSCI